MFMGFKSVLATAHIPAGIGSYSGLMNEAWLCLCVIGADGCLEEKAYNSSRNSILGAGAGIYFSASVGGGVRGKGGGKGKGCCCLPSCRKGVNKEVMGRTERAPFGNMLAQNSGSEKLGTQK